jgi:GntR family transcriptional regulator
MFQINPSLSTPIYKQIADQVRRQVAGGQLLAGVELPSVRSVALQYAINPMTVSKAYSQLESEGLLCRNRGMGMTVAEQQQHSTHQQRLTLLAPHLQAVARIAQQLQVEPQAAVALFETCLAKSDSPADASKIDPHLSKPSNLTNTSTQEIK